MTEDEFKVIFPALGADPSFRIASEADRHYNCVAWAAGDTTQHWEPIPTSTPSAGGTFWPVGVPVLNTVNSYVAAFVSIGYAECEDGDLEAGYEKVAIFASPAGEPLHVARQLVTGVWTSKLGASNDIEHDSPERLSGLWYGMAVCFLKRRGNATA